MLGPAHWAPPWSAIAPACCAWALLGWLGLAFHCSTRCWCLPGWVLDWRLDPLSSSHPVADLDGAGPHQGCSPRIDAKKIIAPVGLCFMGLADWHCKCGWPGNFAVGSRAWRSRFPERCAAWAHPHGGTDPIFLAELRRRLGVPDAARDTWCPRRDGILDPHSNHAGMCLAGGDRTRRHHAARGLVAALATCAGLVPELEKAERNCFSHNGRTMQGLHSGGPLMFTFPLLRAPQLRLSWPSLAACGWSRSRKLDGMPWQLQVSTPTSRSRT